MVLPGPVNFASWLGVVSWRGRHEPAVLRPSAVADIFQVFVLIINTALVTPAPRICQAITWKIRRSPRRPGRRRAGSCCCSRTGGRKRQASWESPCELPARRPGSSWRSWSPKGSSRRRPSRRGSAVRRSMEPHAARKHPLSRCALGTRRRSHHVPAAGIRDGRARPAAGVAGEATGRRVS